MQIRYWKQAILRRALNVLLDNVVIKRCDLQFMLANYILKINKFQL